MKSKYYLLVNLLLLVLTTKAISAEWMTNFEDARIKAHKEDKALLVNFTGTDWCGFCIKLHKAVFIKDEFKKYAQDKFILVELDFPRRKRISDELRAQNKKLARKYSVRGYPTILLMGTNGVPFASTGYKKGSPKDYNEHLEKLLERKKKYDDLYKQSRTLGGLDKAGKLGEALSLIDENLASYYRTEFEELKSLDPEDKTGFVEKQQIAIRKHDMVKAELRMQHEVMKLIQNEQNAKVASVVERFISDYNPQGEFKQKALYNQVFAMPYPPKNESDIDRVIKLMDRIIAVKMDSPMAKQCESVKKKMEDFRGEVKE